MNSSDHRESSADLRPDEMSGSAHPSPPAEWRHYLQGVFESSLDAGVMMDAAGRVVAWNQRAEQVFGWTREEAVATLLSDLIIPPAYHDAHREGLQHYLATGDGPVLGQRVELTAMRKGGEEFPIELSVVPIPAGETVFFHGFVRDISNRTEDAEYRKRMAALVDSSYDAIIGKDMAGLIISWNRGAERIYGFTEQEALGKSVAIMLPPSVDGEEVEILGAMQSGIRLDQFETTRCRKDGKLIPVSLTVSPITDDNGTIIGSSSIERDITESKRQQEELRQAKEAAEQVTRIRGEFLANVSHELRTPMNAIIGMTRIALDESLSDDVRDYVQTANEAAHSLLTLLNDILDFSKLEFGKFTIDEEPFALRATVEDTVKTLSTRAFEKGLELACEISPEVPDALVGDSVRLRQVLTNLIGNAIKFTERGEVIIAVEALRSWQREVRLDFVIRDTGIGISAEDQQRILEPFTQVDASATRRHGGTGLGLAICQELLTLMGGRLAIESEPGRGSRFSFALTFPRRDDGETSSKDATPLERLRNMPVLVVDDNETNRRIVARVLENWSMQPHLAADGREALRLWEQAVAAGSPFPLLVVDALMPTMDGYTLCERIAERADVPPPVILMLSSSDRREYKRRVQQSGVSAWLQKPISQSDLMDAVMRALNVRIVELDDSTDAPPRPQPVRPLSILLAEDIPANQKVVTTILTKRGHRVQVADDGRIAVELAESQVFDVILMDVQMPVMDGMRATAAIRKLERPSAAKTPIIAMTAHAMRGDRERCLQAGMDSYIAKPIDANRLLEVVESFATGASSAPASPPADSSQQKNDDATVDIDMEETIDIATTLQRLAGDWDLFREFIGYFDEDVPGLIAALRSAVDRGDHDAGRRAAHSLKGLAANLGGKRCADVAHQIELLGKAERITSATALVQQMVDEVALLNAALQEHR